MQIYQSFEDFLHFELIKNGIIEIDSHVGTMIGFSSKLFGGGSYLWLERSKTADYKNSETVWICSITSIKNGSFSKLLKNIRLYNWKIKLTNPSYPMKAILTNKGYTKHAERTKYGIMDVWENENDNKKM